MSGDRPSIAGLPTDVELPEGWTPVGAIAVLRCVDAEGARRVVTVYAGDVMVWEALGMLGVAESDVQAHLNRAPTIGVGGDLPERP